ncbi:multidrug resistance regulator 2 [Colletotrichum fructicola]|nr:multidrug resistance regulator 2 [Colletotrichum fructicola]
MACDSCRQLKSRCDGQTPCKLCDEKNQECVYRAVEHKMSAIESAEASLSKSLQSVDASLKEVLSREGLFKEVLSKEGLFKEVLSKEGLFKERWESFASTKLGSQIPRSLLEKEEPFPALSTWLSPPISWANNEEDGHYNTPECPYLMRSTTANLADSLNVNFISLMLTVRFKLSCVVIWIGSEGPTHRSKTQRTTPFFSSFGRVSIFYAISLTCWIFLYVQIQA